MSAALESSPNAVAERLTGRDYVSFSALTTYRQCPLRYFFKYVVGLPEEIVSANLVFGGAIHRAAEFHFRELLAGNPRPNLDALLSEYQDAWREHAEQQIQFGKGDDVNTLGSLAERVLAAFRHSDFASPAGTILGVEEELRGQVAQGCPDLLARVDLIVDEGDALVVTDLKTARSRWSNGQVEASAEQLLLYHELASALVPGRPVQLEFAVVTKTKTPIIERYPVAVDQMQLQRTKTVVDRVWRAIEAEHFFPAPSPMNCSSCPYREPCQAWQG